MDLATAQALYEAFQRFDKDDREAKRLNLVNYLIDGDWTAFEKALEIARALASHPQRCMRNDRLSMLRCAQGLSMKDLMREEFARGMDM